MMALRDQQLPESPIRLPSGIGRRFSANQQRKGKNNNKQNINHSISAHVNLPLIYLNLYDLLVVNFSANPTEVIFPLV
ncbi:hypothetical protein A8M44_23960 [Escherichia coli]|nr:hypothetical protein A8M44_23960 [Escherichia coli]RCO72798.1 hypothetical protein A6591_25150 [Escherichia coli]